MSKNYTSQEEAMRIVGSWRLGIKGSTADNFRLLIIPKGAVIGLKRWGTLDYLSKKHNWRVRREI